MPGCMWLQDVYVGSECAEHKQHLEISYPVSNGVVQARAMHRHGWTTGISQARNACLLAAWPAPLFLSPGRVAVHLFGCHHDTALSYKTH